MPVVLQVMLNNRHLHVLVIVVLFIHTPFRIFWMKVVTVDCLRMLMPVVLWVWDMLH